MLLQLYALNYTVHSCQERTSICLGINKNWILLLKFYLLMIGNFFLETSFLAFLSNLVSLNSCSSSTAPYPVWCTIGHFQIMMWSLALKFCFVMNQHDGQQEHSWKSFLYVVVVNHLKIAQWTKLSVILTQLLISQIHKIPTDVKWHLTRGKHDGREIWMGRNCHVN